MPWTWDVVEGATYPFVGVNTDLRMGGAYTWITLEFNIQPFTEGVVGLENLHSLHVYVTPRLVQPAFRILKKYVTLGFTAAVGISVTFSNCTVLKQEDKDDVEFNINKYAYAGTSVGLNAGIFGHFTSALISDINAKSACQVRLDFSDRAEAYAFTRGEHVDENVVSTFLRVLAVAAAHPPTFPAVGVVSSSSLSSILPGRSSRVSRVHMHATGVAHPVAEQTSSAGCSDRKAMQAAPGRKRLSGTQSSFPGCRSDV